MQCILYNKKSKAKTIYTILQDQLTCYWYTILQKYVLIIFWIVTSYPLCEYHLIMHSSVAQPHNKILYLQWCCSCWMKARYHVVHYANHVLLMLFSMLKLSLTYADPITCRVWYTIVRSVKWCLYLIAYQ